MPHKAAFEEIDLALGAKDGIVKLHGSWEQLVVGYDDFSLCHGGIVLRNG
jgi:hypothetical protein